ncbi:conserved hypothetical protein [Ricinus communis]|uniref:Uncharacterized protein n=1 Tax=Ricinus communis TaxID=3988 RepID=B9SAA6_RICCO|nr:conserved hypothetical protein [Ricinus communis]
MSLNFPRNIQNSTTVANQQFGINFKRGPCNPILMAKEMASLRAEASPARGEEQGTLFT